MDTAASLKAVIDTAWENRAGISASSAPAEVKQAVGRVLAELDAGRLRVAQKEGAGVAPSGTGSTNWVTNQWVKKAVLLSFRLDDNRVMEGGATRYYDKVPSKFGSFDFAAGGFRVVPPAIARRGAYIARNVVLMPSFVNIGGYVDEGTMVDTWATVGSCAQIGKNVHLSGGVGIGGVLEPVQANPVIIEDNCFIGARSEVVEGVIVGTGAVLSMGVFISATTKVVDRATGQIHVGKGPPYSVVVPGNIGGGPDRPSTYCAVIVKTVDERTRSKTSINELLRD